MMFQTEEAEAQIANAHPEKDMIANRVRLGPKQKLHLLWNSLRENGVVWTSILSAYYISSGLSEACFAKLQKLKLESRLPGISSLKANKEIWEHWNWERGGEEWSRSPQWKESVVKNVLCPYVRPGGHILEIGPGAGRWTEVLVGMTDTFTAVDIAESCLQICQERFGGKSGMTFLLGNGSDLAGVADASIDSIWSFDAFVHINASEAAGYVEEFKRVMRPNSVGVVHHGGDGGFSGGWRSDLTPAAFRELLEEAGFRVVRVFQSWQDGDKQYDVEPDAITVFAMPHTA